MKSRTGSEALIDVAVVGGGLAGLLTAITATDQPRVGRVVIFDGHPLGGRARCDDLNGFRFNRGPRALYLDGPADRLLTSLGALTRTGGPPDLHGAGAVRSGKVHLLPQGPWSALRTTMFTAREKVGFAATYARFMRAQPAELAGRTLASWLDEVAPQTGPRQMVEALVRVATYAHVPELIDAGAAIANAQAGIRPGVRYLDGGWQVFVDHLTAAAEASHIEIRREAVQVIERGANGEEIIRTSSGELRARSVVVAAGTPEAAIRLLGGRPDAWPKLGPPVTAACLELGVRRPQHRRFVLGIDEPLYLSTHAPPADLAPAGQAVVHLMRYHHPDEDRDAEDDRRRLRALAAGAVIGDAEVVQQRFLAKMTVSSALPLASEGGLTGRPAVAVPGRVGTFLAGDWVGPKGLLLDAVASSAADAGRLAGQAVSRSASMSVP